MKNQVKSGEIPVHKNIGKLGKKQTVADLHLNRQHDMLSNTQNSIIKNTGKDLKIPKYKI